MRNFAGIAYLALIFLVFEMYETAKNDSKK